VNKRSKKNLEKAFLQSYIYISKVEVNVTDCTDQHLGGGCSKTVAGIENLYRLRMKLDIKRSKAKARDKMIES
jgi:hypothetical protein